MALNGFICAEVPLRNYSLTHSPTHHLLTYLLTHADLFIGRDAAAYSR